MKWQWSASFSSLSFLPDSTLLNDFSSIVYVQSSCVSCLCRSFSLSASLALCIPYSVSCQTAVTSEGDQWHDDSSEEREGNLVSRKNNYKDQMSFYVSKHFLSYFWWWSKRKEYKRKEEVVVEKAFLSLHFFLYRFFGCFSGLFALTFNGCHHEKDPKTRLL